ncbi:MAG: DUF1993 domain-containing protein [Pseudomonadales bacterium]|nr:DUF1993 domain-containing protein [Pseudomonadales bacterium]
MSLSIDQVAIPTFTRSLTALQSILNKGADFAKEKNIEAENLVNARLIVDMHPLKRQVQMVTDTARRALCQLAGQEVPVATDNEETFEALQKRVADTLAFVAEFDASSLQGTEGKVITLPFGENGLDLDGCTFLMSFAIPNFYFHMAACYNILRSNGVAVGKMDFLGAP